VTQRIQTIGALVLAAATAGPACISAPDVVLVDRKTLLEEQASGELTALENELREEVLTPHATPFTRAQLAEVGADLSRDTLARIVAVHALVQGHGELLDDLLVRRCVGEANSGLIEETPATCAGRVDGSRTSAAVQRVNRGRRQLWQYLHEQQPEESEDALRTRWRSHHLQTVVCGGQVQADDGTWSAKRC
jgi:hypothetical protein